MTAGSDDVRRPADGRDRLLGGDRRRDSAAPEQGSLPLPHARSVSATLFAHHAGEAMTLICVRLGGEHMSEEPPGGDAPKAPPEMFLPRATSSRSDRRRDTRPTRCRPHPSWSPTASCRRRCSSACRRPTPPTCRANSASASSSSCERDTREGVQGAGFRVQEFVAQIAPGTPTWMTASHTYLTTSLTADQIRTLAQWDAAECAEQGGAPSMTRTAPRWCIHRIWPNFETRALIHRTLITTKCDAVHRSFKRARAGHRVGSPWIPALTAAIDTSDNTATSTCPTV